VFGFAFKDGLVDHPVKFGASFAKPSRKMIRQAKNAAGSRMIEADVLRKIIDAVSGQMKAMILLGLNCGFGQNDAANLPLGALDLEGGWVNFPRPKTAIDRRCPLWPETTAALREAISVRPDPKDDADDRLVFLTRYGRQWVRMNDRGPDRPATPIDSIQLQWRTLLGAVGVPHVPFYSLRRIHRTIADRSKDQSAVDHIMGHTRDDMASAYRERIDDDQLEAVVKIVRGWLFPDNTKQETP
jgi:integrase